MPKVSVIIHTFNRSKLVCETIDSVLAQTYKDYELIVVDDGSADNTREELAKYGDKVKYIYQENQGIHKARLCGINQAKGKYFAFSDDDNPWLPNKLELQVKVLENDLDLAFVACQAYRIDGSGEEQGIYYNWKGHECSFEALYDEPFVSIPEAVLVRKECFFDAGGFDAKVILSECYDLWLRLSKKYKFCYVSEPVVKYRWYGGNISWDLDKVLKCRMIVLNKKETIKGLNYFKKIIGIAKTYHRFAQYHLDKKKYLRAAEYFLRSILVYPFVGRYFWPEEIKNIKFSIIYRILKPYFLGIEVCIVGLWQKLRKV